MRVLCDTDNNNVPIEYIITIDSVCVYNNNINNRQNVYDNIMRYMDECECIMTIIIRVL